VLRNGLDTHSLRKLSALRHTRQHEASALKASWAWAPVVLGAVIALLGVILASGGVYLAMLGGSLYYAIVGVTLLAAGYLMMRRRIAGFYVYVGAFVFRYHALANE
jgi:hypothetical protein